MDSITDTDTFPPVTFFDLSHTVNRMQHTQERHISLMNYIRGNQGFFNSRLIHPICAAVCQGCLTCVEILLGTSPLRPYFAATAAFHMKEKYLTMEKDQKKCFELLMKTAHLDHQSQLWQTMPPLAFIQLCGTIDDMQQQQHTEQNHSTLEYIRNQFQGIFNFEQVNPVSLAVVKGCPTCVEILLGPPPFRLHIAIATAYQVRREYPSMNENQKKCFELLVANTIHGVATRNQEHIDPIMPLLVPLHLAHKPSSARDTATSTIGLFAHHSLYTRDVLRPIIQLSCTTLQQRVKQFVDLP